MSARLEMFFKGWGVIFGVPALFLCAYIYALIPALAGIPLCAARHFLGVTCPGCGLTTSFSLLVHGCLRQGIGVHPLGPVIAVFLAYLFFRSVVSVAAGRRLPDLLTQRSKDILTFVFLVALLGHWVFELIIF